MLKIDGMERVKSGLNWMEFDGIDDNKTMGELLTIAVVR